MVDCWEKVPFLDHESRAGACPAKPPSFGVALDSHSEVNLAKTPSCQDQRLDKGVSSLDLHDIACRSPLSTH